ncbi:MAG: acyl-CoA thioesterase/BAAT N-terminal domain-containing protein [Actinocatenispora sp.]
MSRPVRLTLVLTLLAMVTACTSERHPALTVTGSDLLIDRPLHVAATGLTPGGTVTIRAGLADRAGRHWTSWAAFVADGNGRLDLDRARPRRGRYKVADSMGLFWSMTPTDGSQPALDLPDRTRVTLTVSEKGSELARRTVVRRTSVPGLRQKSLTVRKDGILGVLFEPPHTTHPRPAMVQFGGSEGGLGSTLLAKLLAAHGYPVLHIGYFGAPGLPDYLVRVPVEYAGRAVRYLSRQPGVDPHRIAVMGASRGGELAELLGVHYPDLVHGVVAWTPANVAVAGQNMVSPAWTWHGRPVPYTRQFNQPAPTDHPDAVIPVERIAGPVLTSCGGVDEVWESCPYTHAIMARLDAHHHRYADRLLSYPDAGHHSNGVLPYVPRATDAYAQADEAARVAEWPVLLHWLDTLPAGKN